MKKHQKPILLNLSETMFDQVDELATALGKTRSAFLRQSINRNVAFVRQHELPLVQKLEEDFSSIQIGRWLG